MPINTLCPKYRAGQRLCPICSDPLGAHQVWPGATYRYCMKPECTDAIRGKRGGFYIASDIIKCERPGCEAHLPEGRYAHKATFKVHSVECWYAMAKASPKALPCGCGCGEMVIRPCLRTSKSGLVFVDSSHLGHYWVQKNVLESCGSFSPLASTYLDWAATSGQFAKSTIREIRYAVCKLFLYMSESAVEDVRLVKPRHIFDFISWAARHEILNVGHSMTHLSTFFGWLYANELVDANPIVPRFHYPKRKARKPRPLSDADVHEVWKLLHERGTSKLWFAMALALEAGLRIGEVCNLRLEDVDIEGRRCFVRLPNKASKERHAHFHDLTAQYFDLWMSERDSSCDHDHVIYNEIGTPCTSRSLHNAFARVLCRNHKGKELWAEGFEAWSTHRARHTMATGLANNGADIGTISAQGGWGSLDALSHYVSISTEASSSAYETAMAKINGDAPGARRKLSLKEKLAKHAAATEGVVTEV